MNMEGFVPHGVCLLWTWPLIALIVAGNLWVFSSYARIPLELIRALRNGHVSLDRGTRRVLLDFALFILFCGVGHLWQILLLWVGGNWYWAEAIWTLAGTGYFSGRAAWRIAQRSHLYVALLQAPLDYDALVREKNRLSDEIAMLRLRLG